MLTTSVQPLLLSAAPNVRATLDSYALSLAARKLRPLTIATYMGALESFLDFLGPDATLADVDASALVRYQTARSSRSSATIAKDLSALRSYCAWTIAAGLRLDDPSALLVFPRKRTKVPRVLRGEELVDLERILDRPAPVLDRKQARLWRRNTRVVLLLLYTGMRRAEVARASWEDTDVDARTLIVASDAAKGGNERVIPLHPRVVAELQTTPARARRGALAGHMDGRCLSPTTIGHVFDRWLRDHGVQTTAHKLRHTFATQLLRHGANVHDVQRALGHIDIRTTERYLHFTNADTADAVARLPDRLA